MSVILNGSTGITTPGLINTGSETVVNLTTSGNTILGDASTDTLNVGNGGLVKDASGNVGVGVGTPASYVGASGGLVVAQDVTLVNNTTQPANNFPRFFQKSGIGPSISGYQFTVNTGGSGSSAPTERMIVDFNGNLGLGVTPSAWYTATGFKALQFGAGALSSFSTTNFIMRQNAYAASGTATETYVNNGFASYYIQTAGSHGWATAPSGTAGNAITFTQAMTLDASGNLGLGVTPSAWASYQKAIDIGGAGNYGSLSARGGLTELANNNYYNDVGTSSDKYKNTAAASKYSMNGSTHQWWIAPSGTAGNAITFTQAMTLDASGNLLVGTTTSTSLTSGNLVVGASSVYASGKASVTFNGDYSIHGLVLQNTGTITTGSYMMKFYQLTNTLVGSIQSTSTSTAYVTSSDYRLKTNVAPLTNALDTVSKLKPSTFDWISSGNSDNGFIAHELQEVLPNAVMGEKDATEEQEYEISPAIPALLDEEGNEVTPAVEAVMGTRTVPVYQGIDTSFLVATLTAAIQELKAELDITKAKVAALEAA